MWQTLAWTLAPLVATVVAVVVVNLRNRPRGPAEAFDSVQAYARFRAAMGQASPTVPSARREEPADTSAR